MKKRQLWVVFSSISVILVLAVLPFIVTGVQAAPEKIRLIASGSATGSNTWTWATAMALLAERHSPRLKIDIMPDKGPSESLRFVIQGKSDLSQCYEFICNWARAGEEGFADLGPKNNFRIIYQFQLVVGIAIVLDKSPIKAFSYKDLKGKTVATRQPGSSGIVMTVTALRALGLDPRKDVKLLTLNQSDGYSALLDGTADMWMGNQGFNYRLTKELALTKPCRFLPIPEKVINATREVLGAIPGKLPKGMYKGLDETIPVPLTASYWYVPEKLPDDVVYELVKLWWEHMDERNQVHPTIKRLATVELLKETIPAAKTPLHPGALKYYREKGWFK